MSKNNSNYPHSLNSEMWILHICHCHYPPFLDVARQYNSLFRGTPYKVLTVYLTGDADDEIERNTCSDEVIFLQFKSKQVSGLKLQAMRQIKEIVSTKNFYFCIAHRTKPTYLALLATKLPVVSVHHNYGDFDRLSRRVFFNLFKNRLLLIGVSNSVRDELISIFPRWPTDHIETLYNRVDIKAVSDELLLRSVAREKLGIHGSVWVIGCAARLHPNKDQLTLIRAFARALPLMKSNSMLLIMGSGETEHELKHIVNNLGISDHVTFTGYLENGRIYFSALDTFVLPSKREAFGMVLIEAMVANVPVVSSYNGGGAEVVASVGETFDVGDDVQLASILLRLQENQYAEKTAERKLFECFSYDSVQQYFWKLPFINSIKNVG